LKAIVAKVDDAIVRVGDPEAGGFRVGNAGKEFFVTKEEVVNRIAKSKRPPDMSLNDIGRFVCEIVLEKRRNT
jgi:hypothetical protein